MDHRPRGKRARSGEWVPRCGHRRDGAGTIDNAPGPHGRSTPASAASRRSRPTPAASSIASARSAAPRPEVCGSQIVAAATIDPAFLPHPSRHTVQPPLRCRPGDMEERGRMSDRPTVIDDQSPNPQALDWGQSGISVGHEDLLVDETEPGHLHSRPEVLFTPARLQCVVADQPTSLGSTTRPESQCCCREESSPLANGTLGLELTCIHGESA